MNEEELARLKARMEAHEFLMREMYINIVPMDAFKTFIANSLQLLLTEEPQATEQAKQERERVANCIRDFGLFVESEKARRGAHIQKMNQPQGPIQ